RVGPRDRRGGDRAGAGAWGRPKPLAPDGFDLVVADRVDDVLAVEQSLALLRREAVLHVGVVEDLPEATAPPVLAHHVGRAAILGRGVGAEEGEEAAEEARQP